MFLFEKIPMHSLFMALLILVGLIVINEVTRRSKSLSLVMYLLVPILLTIFVWPKTSGSGSNLGYWFPWVKAYSSLAGVLGFMLLRHKKGLDKNKFMLMFPPFILAINIVEAVFRDFQCYNIHGVENGLTMIGGPWNIINGIAGIINIITITGWFGIFISKKKSKDMIWPDLQWFWILAYGVWNFSYIYNCISDRSLYTGLILILASTIPTFFIKKGAWLQHRAQTLALYAMFVLTFPALTDASKYAVKSSNNPKALLLVSILSLAINMGVLIYEIYRIKKYKLNPFKDEMYTDLKGYKEIINENK